MLPVLLQLHWRVLKFKPFGLSNYVHFYPYMPERGLITLTSGETGGLGKASYLQP